MSLYSKYDYTQTIRNSQYIYNRGYRAGLLSSQFIGHKLCYVLTLPLLFLIPLRLLTHLPTKSLILGTVLQSSPSSLILFQLILLISSPILPPSQLSCTPCYILGHIPLTASLSSTLIALTETLQGSSSQPGLIRLICIPWSTPFVMNTSALPTTLMVVTN
jgi:hypothetical protein